MPSFKRLRPIFSPVNQPSKTSAAASSSHRSLTIQYSPTPFVPTGIIADALLNPLSPMRFKALDTMHNQPRDKLVWAFNSNMSRPQLPKAVLRNKLKRRWNEAFRLALKARGYGYHGEKISTGGQEEIGEGVNLKGTMHVLISNAAGWDATPEELLRDAEGIVGALEKEMKDGQSGTRRV